MSEVKVTYETLFGLLRTEKSREELQELEPQFFEDLNKYLNEKIELSKRQEGSLNAFMDNEKEKEVYNIKRIIKELYERREKKIVDMALNKSKTKSNIINIAVMMPEEKLMFESITTTLDKFREGILINLLDGKQAIIQKEEIKTNNPQTQNKIECEETNQNNGMKCIKFKHAVPQFLGKELEKYGPFEEGDQIQLPPDIADILINKGRAEELTLNP